MRGHRAPLPPADRSTHGAAGAAARAAMGDDAFEATRAEGYALPTERAVAQAVGDRIFD